MNQSEILQWSVTHKAQPWSNLSIYFPHWDFLGITQEAQTLNSWKKTQNVCKVSATKRGKHIAV